MKQGRGALFQVPAGGGEPVEIPLPFSASMRVFGFLPRESALLMRGADGIDATAAAGGGTDLWIVPVPGTPRRVGLRANSAAVSPDGERLAFFRGTNLCLARLDGSALRDLLSVPSPGAHVDSLVAGWAAPALRLGWPGRPGALDLGGSGGGRAAPAALARADGGLDARRALLRVSSAGSVVGEERHLGGSRAGPAALVAARPHAIDLRAHQLRGRRAEPRREAALRLRGDPERRVAPLRRRRAGGFESVLGGVSALYADVSRDGEWLAWVSYPEGTLWRARADGSERRQLTSPPLTAHLPRWSPDGRAIVFVGAAAGERGRVPAAGDVRGR